MRIVFTSYSYTAEFTNPEDWLFRIRSYTGILECLATEHEVFSIERINFRGEAVHKGVHYYFTRLNKLSSHIPLAMHRLIRSLRPDVVFINGFIFPFQIIQLKLTLGPSVKIIILHRAEQPFRGLKRIVQRVTDGCVDYYLFASRTLGDEWIRSGIVRNKEKIQQVLQSSSVFYPIERELARTTVSVSGNPVFLWVGRLDANKDPFTIIKAFEQYASINPGARLYMIYQTEDLLGEIKAFIAEKSGLGDVVKMVGPVTHDQLIYWYNAADYILSGSHYEGSGVAVVEAMSCGCIPIVTTIDSFRGMLGDAFQENFFKPGDASQLVKILTGLRNEELDMKRRKVLYHFREELSFEAIAGKINQLIRANPQGYVSI